MLNGLPGMVGRLLARWKNDEALVLVWGKGANVLSSSTDSDRSAPTLNDADALVMLTSRHDPAQRASGGMAADYFLAYLRQQVSVHVRNLTNDLVAQSVVRGGEEALALIHGSTVISAFALPTAPHGRDRHHATAYKPPSPGSAPLAWHASSGLMRETVVFQLAVIACLDRFLAAASLATTDADGPLGELDLCDVLVGSIHSRINGAYLFPAFDWAHELLATGAWLGHLLQGRHAVLPDVVADCLWDYRPVPGRQESSDVGRCVQLLWHHAELAIGARELQTLAEHVRDSGGRILARPRLRGAVIGPAPYIWNPKLFARINAQLQQTGSSECRSP